MARDDDGMHTVAVMQEIGTLPNGSTVYWAEPGRFERPGFQVWNERAGRHDWYALCEDDPAQAQATVYPDESGDGAVFTRPECLFAYCPNKEHCMLDLTCQHPASGA